jgi:hypothetical protein
MSSSVAQSLHDEVALMTDEILRRLALAAARGDRATFDFLARTLERLFDAMENHGDH